jgi:hypothetical protein
MPREQRPRLRALQSEKAIQHESGWPLPEHNSQIALERPEVELHNSEVSAWGNRMSRAFFPPPTTGLSR